MLKKFLSTIGIGSMKVDTVVDKPEISHGESLSGKIYINGGQCDQMIEYIKLEVLKRKDGYRVDSDFDRIEETVGKHTIEMLGSLKSKETRMVPFEIMPDDRWESEDAKLFLRTSVHIINALDVQDEDEIIYAKDLL